MNTPTSNIGHAFATHNVREVAAMITFTKTPSIKANYNSGSGLLAQLLQSIEKAPGLIVRRPWFGFDKMLVDDFSDRVKKVILDSKDVSQEMARIQKTGRRVFPDPDQEIEDDARIELSAAQTSLIRVDLSRSADPALDIRLKVPMEKLQKFLLRAYQATEHNGSAQMTGVKIAYAPRFDNSNAPVKELLSYDQE